MPELQNAASLQSSSYGESSSDVIRTEPRPYCYLCGSDGHELYTSLRDKLFGAPGEWTLKECDNSDCGLVWLDPMPLEADIVKAYKIYYTHHPEFHEPKSTPSPHHDVDQTNILRRIFQFLKKGFLAASYGYTKEVSILQELCGYLMYLNPLLVRRIRHGIRNMPCVMNGRLLDIGCGDGNYMLLMKSLGWKVEGTEIDPHATELARSAGLDVHFGDIKQLGLPSSSYDAIVLNHVLEHVHDPLELLIECHRLLKPGGHIRVILPNLKSLGHKRFRKAWRGLEPPRHIHQFTPMALETIGNKAGFDTKVVSLAQGAPFFYRNSFLLKTKRGILEPLDQAYPWRTSINAMLFGLWETVRLFSDPNLGEELLLEGTKFRKFKVEKIGIAMAVYQPHAEHLREQLASIQSQTWQNWVCVVSFDSDMDSVLSHASVVDFRKDKRFLWVQNPSRFGHKKNFENAIRRVLAFDIDAIAFSDQDDIWFSNKLETLAAELLRRGPGSLVHSDMELLQEQDQKMSPGKTVWQHEQRGVAHVKPHELLTRNVVTGAASLFDAEIAARFLDIPGGLDYHDHWYALVAAYHGGIYPIYKPLYAYRLHSTNVVGVTPFKGLLRFPSDSDVRKWPEKFESGWRKIRQIALASQYGGLNLRLRERLMHLTLRDAGLVLLIEGARRLSSDRPLARYYFVEALGKLMACLRPNVMR